MPPSHRAARRRAPASAGRPNPGSASAEAMGRSDHRHPAVGGRRCGGRPMRTDGARGDHGSVVDDRAPSLTATDPSRPRSRSRPPGRSRGRASAPDATTAIGDLMDPLQQLGALGPQLGAVVGAIRPDQLDDPTPCDGFTVRDVLTHMIAGATVFAAAYRGEDPPRARPGAIRSKPSARRSTASPPPSPRPARSSGPSRRRSVRSTASASPATSCSTAWYTVGTSPSPLTPPSSRPDELVHDAEVFAHQIVDSLRDGVSFADAVVPSADATPIERLVAYTGRRPLTGVTRDHDDGARRLHRAQA